MFVMRGVTSTAIALILLGLISPSQSFIMISAKRCLVRTFAAQKRQPVLLTTESAIDGKSIRDGSLVEYTSTKGSKRLAIVSKSVGAHLDVLNDAKKSFSVPITRVTYHINGTFAFGDLLRLNEILADLKPIQIERLWESSIGLNNPPVFNLKYISKQIFGSTDAVRTFASMKLMSTYGSVFFERIIPEETVGTSDGNSENGANQVVMEQVPELTFAPLSPNMVQQNLRSRAALKEFKQRFVKVMTTRKGGGGRMGSYTALMPDMPDRVQEVVGDYAEGLKQLIIQGHPWVANGWSRRKFDEKAAGRGREFLEFLELAPNTKNARKVLEMTGIWPLHTNVEKFIMGLRDKFPTEVLDEAQYLLDNADIIPDPDERLRRDLRHLGCYAVDREGAAEVDDAVSIEHLEGGQEKLWVHIADVSRWIRPGSQLSLEAERRMVSVYMPDERISMFPYALSTELLSLGAGVDSYALSCGVTLDANGAVTSFEVCPSRIRITRRLSYSELDDMLAREESNGKILQSLLAGNGVNAESTDPSSSFSQSDSRGGRSNLDSSMKADLSRLNHWAKVRHAHRNKKNALDQYLRHKTELSLSVRTDQKTSKYVVSGFTTWSNATSMSLVSEYMILMCETVGGMCEGMTAPVLYKTQAPQPPLAAVDFELQDGETPFLRSARIMRHLRAATDSKTPGPHCTSGSQAYVQCTSPIRRYHDLYNHYRLKAAMHGASMGEEWCTNNRAEEEAGILRLDGMATSEERLQTLNTVRLVSRHREQYWTSMYINKLVAALPKVVFDCLIVGPKAPVQDGVNPFGEREEEFPGFLGHISDESNEGIGGTIYDALVLQLGSFLRYALYSPSSQPPRRKGELVGCHLLKRYSSPMSYLLVPADFDMDKLPSLLAEQLIRPKKTYKEITEDTDGESSGDGDLDADNETDTENEGEMETDTDGAIAT